MDTESENVLLFFQRESEILFFLLIVVVIRTKKTGSVTMINYLTSSFMYNKVANLILWFYADIRLGIIYGILFICKQVIQFFSYRICHLQPRTGSFVVHRLRTYLLYFFLQCLGCYSPNQHTLVPRMLCISEQLQDQRRSYSEIKESPGLLCFTQFGIHHALTLPLSLHSCQHSEPLFLVSFFVFFLLLKIETPFRKYSSSWIMSKIWENVHLSVIFRTQGKLLNHIKRTLGFNC